MRLYGPKLTEEEKKSTKITIRIDAESKDFLRRSARAYGVSMSSLVAANIKQIIRNGDMYFMLPEHFQKPFDERRENAKAFREFMRSPRSRHDPPRQI